jgi:hypothetical protein
LEQLYIPTDFSQTVYTSHPLSPQSTSTVSTPRDSPTPTPKATEPPEPAISSSTTKTKHKSSKKTTTTQETASKKSRNDKQKESVETKSTTFASSSTPKLAPTTTVFPSSQPPSDITGGWDYDNWTHNLEQRISEGHYFADPPKSSTDNFSTSSTSTYSYGSHNIWGQDSSSSKGYLASKANISKTTSPQQKSTPKFISKNIQSKSPENPYNQYIPPSSNSNSESEHEEEMTSTNQIMTYL